MDAVRPVSVGPEGEKLLLNGSSLASVYALALCACHNVGVEDEAAIESAPTMMAQTTTTIRCAA